MKVRLSLESGFNFHFFAEDRFFVILGSLLESFWEPSSSLYSFLVARGAKTGSQKRGQKSIEKKVVFRVPAGVREGEESNGGRVVTGMRLLTFAVKTELSLESCRISRRLKFQIP